MALDGEDTNVLTPARLAELPIFRSLDATLLESIAGELTWFSLPSGEVLFRTDDQTEALYVVASGVLGVVVTSGQGQGLVAEIHSGETVGEMSLVTGEPHSATVVALRHSELVAMSRTLFEQLIGQEPEFLHWITRLVVQRLRATTQRAAIERRHRSVALVPLDEGLPVSDLAERLVSTLASQPLSVYRFTPAAAEQPIAWFNAVEAAHELVVYETNPVAGELDRWSRFCLRQADRVVFVCRPGSVVPTNLLALVIETEGRSPPIDLIVLERDDVGRHASASASSEQFAAVFHLRTRHPGDIERVARHLTDRSVGIVLSGGAARGFAHIGAIRALREAGIPFDRVGGTSMGGIIGACVAAEWDDHEIRTRMHQSFVETNPLNDYTIPWVALFRGRSVERLLQRHFGDIKIEALWRPFFCASSNLTSGTLTVHRTGPLWRALRASIALPGVLPPVVEHGEVLVDGGVINTFPVDVMAEAAAGPIIGVNVATDLVLTPGEAVADQRSRFRVRFRPDPEMPSMLSILMHATTISSSLQVAVCRSQTTLLLEPPLSHVPLLDWRAFDRAVEAGYRHTATMLERSDLQGLKLLP